MPQENDDENRLTQSNSHVNSISELPGRPFAITMEVPLFLTMLAVSLSGKLLKYHKFLQKSQF